MRQPAQKDREETREYLIKRLEAVRSMSYNLESLFHAGIERIVKILYQFNLNASILNSGEIPEEVLIKINEVIDWMKEIIIDYFDTLIEAAPDSDKDYILPWVKKERGGMTFEQRLDLYLHRFRLEMFLLTAAGIMIGFGSMSLIHSIYQNLKKPWNNPDLKDSVTEIPSYGVGHTNSMFTAINALTRDGVAMGWMKTKFINDRKKDCIGWWVERGSSVPCDICDSQTGFHYNDSSLPLYHLSCCCLAIPVFNNSKFN